MSKLRDAAQQALAYILATSEHDQRCDVLDLDEGGRHKPCSCLLQDALDDLRAALAEQPAEQEPVAWWHRKSNTFTSGNLVSNFAEWAPLYTAPQPAKPAEQEPVAWMCSNTELMRKGYQMFSATGGGDWNIPVYTAPQPRRRLTDEEIDNTTRKQVDCLLDHIYEYGTAAEGIDYRLRAIARAIERAHGIGEHD